MTNEQAIAYTVLAMRRQGMDELAIRGVLDQLLDELFANEEIVNVTTTLAAILQGLHDVNARLDRVEQLLNKQES